MLDVVLGWFAHCWARWGHFGAGNFNIWKGIVYCISIWDVSALQGERDVAGWNLTVGLSQLGSSIGLVRFLLGWL